MEAGTRETPRPALEVVRDEAQASPQWDAFASIAPGGHHVQTTMWAAVKAISGWRATRLLVREEGEIVAGCQLLWRSVGRVVRVAYIPRGPLAPADRPDVLAKLLEALDVEAHDRGLAYVKLQPPVDRHDMPAVLQQRGFHRSSLEVGPSASVRVDLTPEPDQLLAAMASRIRRNVRQSERKGLTVRDGGPDDLPAFIEILVRTAERQGFETYPPEYWHRLWEAFAPGGWASLLVTELDGRVLSGLLLVGYGDTVIYKMGGWTGERTKARPNESMHWVGIQWAREAGYRYYDLEGILPEIAEALIAGREPAEEITGVTAFKLSLGGDPVLYPNTYDKLYQPLRARAAQWAAGRGSSSRLVRMVVGRRG